MGPETLLTYLEVALAAGGVLALAKSAYNGYVRRFYVYCKELRRVPEEVNSIYKNVNDVKDTQDDIAQSIYLLSRAHHDDEVEPDPEKVREQLEIAEGPSRFEAED